MSEFLESLEPFLMIASCLGTLCFFLHWPVYQRVVQEREWGTILGITREGSEQGD